MTSIIYVEEEKKITIQCDNEYESYHFLRDLKHCKPIIVTCNNNPKNKQNHKLTKDDISDWLSLNHDEENIKLLFQECKHKKEFHQFDKFDYEKCNDCYLKTLPHYVIHGGKGIIKRDVCFVIWHDGAIDNVVKNYEKNRK